MCMGGGSVPQAPDVSGQENASSAIGQTAQNAGTNQLAWANSAVANNQNQTANVQSQLNPAIGNQLAAGNAASNQFQNQTIGGLNNQLATAQNYGSQAGMDQASANAAASTAQAYNAARLNNQQQLGSYGVDPSQMKSGALNLNANLQQAGAVGNAAYNAGQQRQLTGMGLTSQALGQNLQAANTGQNYTAGANATGSNVVGLGNQTTSTGSTALSAPSQMMQTGLSGYGQSANIANQSFQDQMASYQASQAGSNSLMSGLGSVAGIAAMAMMADGGSPVPPRFSRRYDNGGSVALAPMVPVQGIPQIQSGMQYQDSGQNFGSGLASGAKAADSAGVTGALGNYIAGQQVNSAASQGQRDQMGNQISAMGNADISQAASQPGPSSWVMPEANADGGAIPQRKRMNYGNPAVHPSQGVPPQVGIPGPWIAANGGSTPGPGFIDPSNGPSDGTGIDDQIPAKVSVGEYIIPADVVHAKGKEFFDKLLQRYHVPAQQQRQMMGMH